MQLFSIQRNIVKHKHLFFSFKEKTLKKFAKLFGQFRKRLYLCSVKIRQTNK